MQHTPKTSKHIYVPMVHLIKDELGIEGVRTDGRTQYRVRDALTGDEYYAAFTERAGIHLIQPLEWRYDIGAFEPYGQAVQATSSMEIIGAVTDIYEFLHVPTAHE